MNLREAKEIVGSGLGAPSKMPGASLGISATLCKVGGKLQQVEGSTCHSCYAMKGHYRYNSVKVSHARRLAGFSNPGWTAAMVFLLRRSGETYMRWMDSGDLQSTDMLLKICAVAALTPEIKHWLPTRELSIVKAYIAKGGTVPDNLTIRVSATMIDGEPPKAWPLTSTVWKRIRPEGWICPAPKQDNKCGPCRACWSKEVTTISYHAH